MITLKINPSPDNKEIEDYTVALVKGLLKAWREPYREEKSDRNAIVVARLERPIKGMTKSKLERIVYGN